MLGAHRDQAPLQVVCTLDPESGALFARSAWAGDFAGRVAFADVGRRPRSFTTDRAEFLGRNGAPEAPAALGRARLADRTGELCDPCAALMTGMDLPPGGDDEVVFLLGQADSAEEARRLVRSYGEAGRAQQALEEVQAEWDRILGAVQVRTPDPALDLMLNRWLLYQVLACRVWGRSGFYQSGGAFGFRDQLQDAMALVYGAVEEARAQILRAAARQFEEGDVQHWWHPPAGRGVRTRITDDLYFLPFVTCHYVATTGDAALLDEQVPFLRAPVLQPDQEEDYGLPEVSEETGTVYEHCVRALEYGLRLGPHGLPLMGTGDWNDGMNQVGAGGQGESVWNGWFMLATLREFAGLAEQRRDAARAAWCRERAEALRRALEEHAWDGGWYRRAYFDDGTPLGSAQNDECQIDSIAQSWAVISGAGDPERARKAMAAVEERLVRDADRLILLFAPPFDRGSLEPGYIKGYVPGIRENGGQYTHAATWVVLATALLGQGQAGAGAVRPAQPDPPRRHTRGGRALQGGALRGGGGRLRRAAAYRPGRLDLVHRLGQLAVPRRPGGDSRLPPAGRPAEDRALRPAGLAALRDHLPLPLGDLSHHRGERGRHRPWRPGRHTGRPSRPRWRDPADGRWKSPRGSGRAALNASAGATKEEADGRPAAGRGGPAPFADGRRTRPAPVDHGAVLPARDQPGQRAGPRQDRPGRAMQHRRRRSRPGDDPGNRRARCSDPASSPRRSPAARLRILINLPQGPEPDAAGYKGFFYHFLDMDTGRRVWNCELSTLDSAFLFAGVLTCCHLLRRRHGGRGRGPPPGRRALLPGRLELGTRRRPDAHPRLEARRPASSRTATRATTRGCCSTSSASARRLTRCRRRATPLTAPPISGRRSTAASCSTPGRSSPTSSRTCGSTSAASATPSCASTAATTSRTAGRRPLCSRNTPIRNPLEFDGYGEHCWGFTACDGPGWVKRTVNGVERQFYDYTARGAPFGPDDGTVAPWVVVASLPFAPEIVIPTVRYFAGLNLGMTGPTGSSRRSIRPSPSKTARPAGGSRLTTSASIRGRWC